MLFTTTYVEVNTVSHYASAFETKAWTRKLRTTVTMPKSNKLKPESNKLVRNKIINQHNFIPEFSIVQKNLKWVAECDYT